MVRTAFPFVSLGLGLLVVVVVARRNGANAGDVIHALPPIAHLAALGIMAVELSARALRWVVLGRAAGVRLTFRTSVLGQLAGEAAGAVTPARVGTDPAKLMVGSRDSGSLGGVGAVIAGEVVMEALLLLVVAAGLAAFAPSSGKLPVLGVMAYALFMGGGMAAVVAILILRPSSTPPRFWSLLRLSRRRWRDLRRNGLRLRRHLRTLRGMTPRQLVAIAALTVVHIAARLAVLPVLALAAGAHVGILPLITWALFLLYTTTIVPSPGAGGTVELGFSVALAGLLPAGLLAGLLVWWRFYTFYLGALGGGIALTSSAGRGRLGVGVRRARTPSVVAAMDREAA